MNTPAPTIQQTNKYDKELAEIENLKSKAKQIKPRKNNLYFIKSIITTIFLFFLLFISGFYFSYTSTKLKLEKESAKFTPKAQIKLPVDSEKCLENISGLTDPAVKTLLEEKCSTAQTAFDCEQIDGFNELGSKDFMPDGKADCKWVR